jgi:hypothetical protein
MRRFVSLVGLVAFTCAASGDLHFAGPAYLSRSERSDPQLLRKALQPALARARIDRIELVAGTDSIVHERSRVGELSLDRLPGPALQAAMLVLQEQYRGAEIDILVQGSGPRDPDRMWTVRHDLGHGIVILRGEPPLALDGPDPSSDALGARFGIGPLEDSRTAQWTPDERRALGRALELLSPAERELLRGVAFARQKASPVAMQAGIYQRDPSAKVGRITLFDLAFIQNAKTHYVGAPDAANPYSVYVVTHEIGHAIVDLHRERVLAQYRRALDAYNEHNERLNALIDTYNANVEKLKAAWQARRVEPDLEREQSELDARIAEAQRALEREGDALDDMHVELDKVAKRQPPMEQRYAALPNALAGPTPYGRTAPTESFAESFALYHVDPESLRRIAPEVHAWFAAGEHARIPTLTPE